MADRSKGSGNAGVACNGWDHSGCEGSPYCPPRCPRFHDERGKALVIEPYEPAHRDALRGMYEGFDARDRTLGLPPASDERLEGWLDHLTANGWGLVARHRGDVVGHVAAVRAGDGELELVVFVHEDYRDGGIGTELIEQLVTHADDRGYEALALSVASGNRRAITVYDDVGFDVTERLSTEVEMGLSLERPITTAVKRPPAERG